MTQPTKNKRITQPAQALQQGAFAHVTQENAEGHLTHNGFVYCRETFQQQRSDWRQILFVHPAGHGENIAAFIAQFESKMDHEKLTECGPTNNNQVSWIKPAEFWTRNSMRKSLLTALLRAAVNYEAKKDNFENALYSIPYLANTRAAVQLFLTGHTWAKTHESAGWVQTFNGQNEADVRKTLGLKPVSQTALLKYAAELLKTDVNELTKQYRQNRDKAKREQREKEKEAARSGAVLKS